MHIPTTANTPDAFSINLLDVLVEKGGSQPGGGGGSQLERWSSFIGIATAIIGNLLISFALNTQRYAHILIDREYNELKKSPSNGHLSSRSHNAYGSEYQEAVAEERRRKNLGIPSSRKASVADDTASSTATSLQGNLRRPAERTVSQADLDEDSGDDDQGRPSYLKSTYWWLGLILMIIGETGNFLAYGFAPASIVSPLGVVALISNCLIAPLMLKERFRRRDFYGVVVAVAGAVTVVLSASSSEEKFGPGELWKTIKRWEFLLYVVITTVLIVALMYAEPKYGRRTILVDLGLVGLFGGYTALSTKGVASLLSASLYKVFAYPIFYFLAFILILSALMQIRYLNRGLQNYDSTQVIPTQFVLFTLSVIIGSAVLYRDFEHTTLEQALKFTVGCLLTFFGVYLITSKRDGGGEDEDEEHDEAESIRLLDEEAGDVDERTPLKRDHPAPIIQKERPSIIDRDEEEALPITPRRPSKASSIVPSIAVTPAESLENPWLSSVEEIDAPPPPPTVAATAPPRTPQIARLQSEVPTPFFTPGTSRPLGERSFSSPADPDTPTKLGSPRPPSPDRAAVLGAADSPSFHPRSGRGSISRLIPLPGPLLPPLSSSLSAVVAESLLKGEGASRSVRAALRRSRSGRHSTDESRRRTVVVAPLTPAEGDVVDDPLRIMHWQNRSADSAQALSRAQTHEPVPSPPAGTPVSGTPVSEQDPGGARRKTRLRAFSESLSGMMSRGKNGKARSTGKDPDPSQDPSAEDVQEDGTAGA